MSADEHRSWRESLGAYVLGHLPDAEAAALRAHLDGCPACRAELDEIAPAARALARVDPDALEALPVPQPDLADRIVGRIQVERRQHVRTGLVRRALASAAAVAVTAVVAFTAVVVLRPDPVPMEQVALAEVEPGVDAEASLIAHTWGTELVLTASGLEDGGVYAAAFERSDGTEVPAGTFIGTGDRPLVCKLNAALLRGDAAGFTVRTVEGDIVVRADLPRS